MVYQVKLSTMGVLVINFIPNGAIVSQETAEKVNTAVGKVTSVYFTTQNTVPPLFLTKPVSPRSAHSFISLAQRDIDFRRSSHIGVPIDNAAGQGTPIATQTAMLGLGKTTSLVGVATSPSLKVYRI